MRYVSNPMTDANSLLDAFLACRLELVSFRHADHVQVGFELLRRYDFPSASALFSKTLKRMTSQAGVANVYHETISLAFLALIAERSALDPELDFQSFREANSDLFQKSILERWYSQERLRSDVARRTFVLPDARL
jgi:hypothetical protein